MAKQRGNLDDLFRKTEGSAASPAPTPAYVPASQEAVPRTGRTISVVDVKKKKKVAELDRIVEELDITRNALMRYAIRYFLTQYSAGSINLARDVESPEAKKRLKMP